MHLLYLLLAWLAYFLIHSILAGLWLKRWVASRFPAFMPWYRLAFNLVAVVLLVVPLWLTFTHNGPYIIEWRGLFAWLSYGLTAVALVLFFLPTRYYDGGEFLGLRQLRDNERAVQDQENFQLSPLHRYVRHPWYFLSLVLVWTRDMDSNMLLSAIMITLYFVIGSRLEERKLLLYHGSAYAEYRHHVAGLIPLPWKILSSARAQQLLASARQHKQRPDQ
jgi:protein-S-isoprenylcysteine O-methyltransferase Ste14